MNSRDPRGRSMPMRVFLAAAAVIAITALIVGGQRMTAARRAAGSDEAPTATAVVEPPGSPIAAEADVFRTSSAVLAIDPAPGPRRPAHPRTLATFRSLRAYPGAPPRIPHGLTPSEFRTGSCNTCHERGGYSQRFGAYVPVTPHPDMGACLQCHVGDGALMAIPLPDAAPSARCRQCHTPGATRWTESTVNWTTMAWPALAPATIEGAPPVIPHELEFRGNCLACHAAPAGVAEIRTPHPERANCRQCHLTANAEWDAFAGLAKDTTAAGRGVP